MALYTLPTNWNPNHAPTAAELAQLLAAVQSSINAWTDFSSTFTLTATTTSPTKGNSTYTASYIQIGQTVFYTAKVAIGSTFVAGTGDYLFLLPSTASANAIAGSSTGASLINDSGTAIRIGVAQVFDSTHAKLFNTGVPGGPIGAAGPGTVWASTDHMEFTLIYEAA